MPAAPNIRRESSKFMIGIFGRTSRVLNSFLSYERGTGAIINRKCKVDVAVVEYTVQHIKGLLVLACFIEGGERYFAE